MTWREKEELGKSYWSFACDVMAVMLVHRNTKIFLIWELTSIFIQTVLYTNMAAMQTTDLFGIQKENLS